MYLSPSILVNDRLGAPDLDLAFRVSPSFSVTTHSLTLAASSRPMIVAFVRWKDMTFSNKTQ